MSRIFDYIVVGGGLGGCVVVGWLIEDLVVIVCVFEVGGWGDGVVVNVLIGVVVMMFICLNNWVFDMVLQLGFGGCIGYQLCGRMFGGLLVINVMVYICGYCVDYDGWVVFGNEGWVYDDVLLYFCLSEYNECFDDVWYGCDGLLWVSDLCIGNLFYVCYLEVV